MFLYKYEWEKAIVLSKAKRALNDARMRRRKKRILTGGDAPADWYDGAYQKGTAYHIHWSDSNYLPVWEAICARIPPTAKVLEIGCGPGQLADMLFEKGVAASYVGFDFSPVAVEMARAKRPEQRFEVADAHTTELFTSVDYDTAICTEVLEHITEDLSILSRVAEGTHVLATVPDFDADTHVRWFKDRAEVHERYHQLFSDLTVTSHHHRGDIHGQHGTFFLLDGVRG